MEGLLAGDLLQGFSGKNRIRALAVPLKAPAVSASQCQTAVGGRATGLSQSVGFRKAPQRGWLKHFSGGGWPAFGFGAALFTTEGGWDKKVFKIHWVKGRRKLLTAPRPPKQSWKGFGFDCLSISRFLLPRNRANASTQDPKNRERKPTARLAGL